MQVAQSIMDACLSCLTIFCQWEKVREIAIAIRCLIVKGGLHRYLWYSIREFTFEEIGDWLSFCVPTLREIASGELSTSGQRNCVL